MPQGALTQDREVEGESGSLDTELTRESEQLVELTPVDGRRG